MGRVTSLTGFTGSEPRLHLCVCIYAQSHAGAWLRVPFLIQAKVADLTRRIGPDSTLQAVAAGENWLPPSGTEISPQCPLLPAVLCGASPAIRDGPTVWDTRAEVNLFSSWHTPSPGVSSAGPRGLRKVLGYPVSFRPHKGPAPHVKAA